MKRVRFFNFQFSIFNLAAIAITVLLAASASAAEPTVTLDDFTRSDLVYEIGGENADGGHG